MKSGSFAALSLLVLTSCASITSSGINQLGPDTYAISVRAGRASGGAVGAEGAALEEASDYCKHNNREIMILTREVGRGGTFRTTFRCLVPGDPGLQRPRVETLPNRVIENRQR